MTKELSTSKGFEIDGRSIELRISNQELISHGCKNCIWKLHNQCPHAITEEGKFYSFEGKDVKYSGYCQEYIGFILGLAEPNDSISAVWEKFSLYVSRMQSLEDYKEFIKLNDAVNKARAEGKSYKERIDIEQQLEHLRLYWERLNFMLMKGYGRIADREAKSRDAKKSGPNILGARTVNFNMVEKKE